MQEYLMGFVKKIKTDFKLNTIMVS